MDFPSLRFCMRPPAEDSLTFILGEYLAVFFYEAPSIISSNNFVVGQLLQYFRQLLGI